MKKRKRTVKRGIVKRELVGPLTFQKILEKASPEKRKVLREVYTKEKKKELKTEAKKELLREDRLEKIKAKLGRIAKQKVVSRRILKRSKPATLVIKLGD